MLCIVTIVKNGERRLPQMLQAAAHFAEVILYDTGSTDGTLEIAKKFSNVRLLQGEFVGFGAVRNRAALLASHDWILALDADEILSPALIEEIKNLKLEKECVYSLPFHNYLNGKWIRSSGWHPERHVRLYHRKTTAFSEALVHEGVICDHVRCIKLKQPVQHYPYETLSDFLIKMERYSSLFAQQYQKKRRSSPAIALLHAWVAFFKSYVLKRGFISGYEGFLIASYNAHTAFYKYLKLYHMNKQCS
jgi:glycosyltransferase involved in cell wall biosynthesis